MKRIIVYSISIFIGLQFYSCKCDDQHCPGFNNVYLKYFPDTSSTPITYINGLGDSLSFTKSSFYKTNPITIQCSSSLYNGCYCRCSDYISSQLYLTTNDSLRSTYYNNGQVYNRNNIVSYEAQANSPYKDTILFWYRFLDDSYSFQIDSSKLIPNYGDQILPLFTAGGKTYSNVLVHYNDTTTRVSPEYYTERKYVWSLYYAKGKGVVAFFDRLTNSLFYLKD